ncbi:MAG: SIR2 family NAD-dependent protein deacylase, partial [Planctomycetia bacterium]
AELDAAYDRAVDLLDDADALLVAAGAGMGVDSGLPDFRGDEGFWKAYPPFRGRSFPQMSNPAWFERDLALAWGFFGHRLQLYRAATPHDGFGRLLAWSERMPAGGFVFTSNVDGQFHKAGFDPDCIVECHGSIHHLQCTRPCCEDIHAADDLEITVDMETIRATSPTPVCPRCDAPARPNVLMFGDGAWIGDRTNEQHARFDRWRNRLDGKRLVVVEMGAGLAIPSVRLTAEECAARSRAGAWGAASALPLVRINPREPETPPGGVSLPVGAAAALAEIDRRWAKRRGIPLQGADDA